METKGIIFYTDNQLPEEIASVVQKQLLSMGLPISCASLKPMDFGSNVVIDEPRGYLAYFKQIIAALENSTADIVYFCEHDVLYHPSHFDFVPPTKDKFYYNQNVWRLKYPEDYAVAWDANQVAELVCDRELALAWYDKKLEQYLESLNNETKFDRKFEPEGKDKELCESWRSAEPNIDIRRTGEFGSNLTKSKWSLADFRDKSTAINFREGKCPEWAKELLDL